ncbi:MAG: hypothetical protein HYV07_28645 [Deltaproteobacteria bacterium]|nr:hypothetical protein [Deltaproteobacteria bacterium]
MKPVARLFTRAELGQWALASAENPLDGLRYESSAQMTECSIRLDQVQRIFVPSDQNPTSAWALDAERLIQLFEGPE